MVNYKFLYYAFLVASVAADWTSNTWDIIVVGAGTAGIIVADRMAEANLSTLLIEQGGPSYGVTGGDLDSRRPSWINKTWPPLSRVDVPGFYATIWTEAGGNLTCDGFSNGFSGCTIGGSSAINAGLFLQPPASDWDDYFPEGWRSVDMQDAIKRLIAKQPFTDNTSMDGKRYMQSGYEAAKKWVVDGLGFKEVDLNGNADAKTAVFGRTIYDFSNGQRGGPVTTYLQEALKRPNFHLQSSTRVVRVERDGNNATGVTVLLDNTETLIKLSARGKVILSAGGIMSPSLLMFSGIGNENNLTILQNAKKLSPNLSPGSWINSSSIGTRLFDNPATFIGLQSESITPYSYSYNSPLPTDESLYLNNRSGPYTSAGQTAIFFDKVNNIGFQGTIGVGGYGDYSDNHTVALQIYGTSGLSSRGNVILTANDKGEYIPGPDDNLYYSSGNDSLAIATWIHKIFSGLNNSDITPVNIAKNSTVEEILKYITTPSFYAMRTVQHWSGSCAIGKCVDKDTTVLGMANLHVVDASILEPLSVNPQFAVMAAAERASDLILGMYGMKIPRE